MHNITLWLCTDRPAGERQSSLVLLYGVDHTELYGKVAVGIGDDGVGKVPRESAVALNVLDPAIVGVHGVTGQSDHPHIALLKFRDEFCNHAQLSGAHWGEVGRVGEKNTPSI